MSMACLVEGSHGLPQQGGLPAWTRQSKSCAQAFLPLPGRCSGIKDSCTCATCSQADPHHRTPGPCRRHVNTWPQPSPQLASARACCLSGCGASALATDKKPLHCAVAGCLLYQDILCMCAVVLLNDA